MASWAKPTQNSLKEASTLRPLPTPTPFRKELPISTSYKSSSFLLVCTTQDGRRCETHRLWPEVLPIFLLPQKVKLAETPSGLSVHNKFEERLYRYPGNKWMLICILHSITWDFKKNLCDTITLSAWDLRGKIYSEIWSLAAKSISISGSIE